MIPDEIKEKFAFIGSGFENGKIRIMNFFKENNSTKERAVFLKKEYGLGGFGTGVKKPMFIHDYDTFYKGICKIKWYDENIISNEGSMTFSELAVIIDKLIREERYLEEKLNYIVKQVVYKQMTMFDYV